MLNRDFTKSSREYVKKNWLVLACVGVIILMGIIMMCAMGFNAGADLKGYNTFSVKVGSQYQENKSSAYIKNIKNTLVEFDSELYSVQLAGEGDSTRLVVKYRDCINNQAEFNAAIAEDLGLDASLVTEHTWVEKSVRSNDYIFAVTCGLIIVTCVAVYLAIRYNLACAITSIVSSFLSIALLLSLVAIFRLRIESSFLAINIITLLLVLCENVIVFDSLEKSREQLKDKNDRNAQLQSALTKNAFRQRFMYAGMFAVVLLFVIMASASIKQASLVLLFALVVVLFLTVYGLPFLWSLTITQVSDKIRAKKDKKVKEPSKDIEGELENNYTENQVIEVKEDDGNDTSSSDENITID